MKHFFDIFDIRRLRKIGSLALRYPAWGLLLAGGLVCASDTGKVKPAQPPVAVAAAVPAAAAYTLVGYDRQIQRADFDSLGKAAVLQLQKQLQGIYYGLPDWQTDYVMKERPLNDGIVGPITLSWLQRYGYNFKVRTGPDYARALPAHVGRIAAFGKIHPDALAVLLSKEFDAWDESQPAAVKASDYAIRRQGQEPELLALVNRFRASQAPALAPRATESKGDSGAFFTYSLNQDDLVILAGKDQLQAMLGTLKDKKFRSLEEMEVALLKAIGGREALLKSLWPVVRSQAQDFYGYRINDAALNKLAKEGLLKGDNSLDDGGKPLDSPLDRLRRLGTVYLPSRADFEEFIDTQNTDNGLALTDEDRRVLEQGTRVFDNYHLDEQALNTIQDQLKNNILNVGIPETLVRMLTEIKDVDYPDVGVFRSAAISKIDFGLAMCRLNSPSNNPYVATLRISDVDMAALQKQLQALPQYAIGGIEHRTWDWDAAFKMINDLRARVDVCDAKTDKDSKQLVQDIYQIYLGGTIESLARKKMPDQLAAPNIIGGQCGCAWDELPSTIYAFYPYWKSQKEAQPINFHALNRVAYLGLTVDNVGNFMLGANNYDLTSVKETETNFVRIAHQYNSKVDWTIQKNDWDGDWKNFSEQSKVAVLAQIRSNILALLTAPLQDLTSRLQAHTTFGLEPRPRRGDGVTLYFPNYPDDPNSTRLFNDFFKHLRTQLEEQGLGLNLLVSQDVLIGGKTPGLGTFGLNNLISLRKQRLSSAPRRAGGAESDEFILVLMNEPSSDAKKALRTSIEDSSLLHGAERIDFLRNILPVLHFDNHNWQQLEDDIVYARDNFGGLGLWAPDFNNLAQAVKDPALSCLKSELLSACLLRDYTKPNAQVSVPGALEMMACIERWTLRVVLFALLLLGAVLAALFFWRCEVRRRIRKYLGWVVASIGLPALLIVFLLFAYDPLLWALSSSNWPFIFLAVCVAVGIGLFIYWRKEQRLPTRQRSMAARANIGFPILVWRTEANEHGFQWIIKNNGSGYATIKKMEILFDQLPFADIKAALESVFGADNKLHWKSPQLEGQRLEAGAELLALSIAEAATARAVQDKLDEHQLELHILYGGAGSETWVSDGKGVRSVSFM